MSDILRFPDPMERQGFERLECKPKRKRSAPKPCGNPALRCRGGCGKKAEWPRDGSPLFCTMICGYRYAVTLFRQKRV